MYGERIQVAVQAMDLFIRSLPKGCKFSIISFGSDFEPLHPEKFVDYNN